MSNDLKIIAPTDGKLPAHLTKNAGDAAMGRKNLTADDLATPRLVVLQAIDNRLQTIKGASVGQFVNTATNELYDEVYVMNLDYRREYAVFRKRKLGGGLVGVYDTEAEAKTALEAAEGNEDSYDIVDTAKHTLLIVDQESGNLTPVQMFFKSTAMKTSGNWNSAMESLGPDAARFAGVWRLSTTDEKNSQGSWKGLDVEFVGWAPSALYDEAKSLYLKLNPDTKAA